MTRPTLQVPKTTALPGFREFYLRTRPRLYGLLCHSLPASSDRENLLQDIYARLLLTLTRQRDIRDWEAYLFRMAQNRIYQHLRNKNRVAPESTKMDYIDIDPSTPMAQREELETLTQCIGKLPQPQQQIVHIRHQLSRTFDHAADMLGTPVKTLVSRYRYALNKLKICMEKDRG